MRSFFNINRYLKYLFVVSAVMFGYRSAHADYITAADLSYTCQNGVYKFNLTVFTECASTVDLSTRGTFEVAFVSKKLGVNSKFTVSKSGPQGGEELKIFCDKEITNCTSSNGLRGVKRFVYSGDLNLAGYGKTDDWQIFWQQNFRSQQLTSVVTNGEPFFVGLTLNTNLATCNNSPTFGSEPIIRACIGAADSYQLAASDVDGDQLRYSIIDPKTSLTTNIGYKAGFSKTVPVSGSAISVDNTGKVTYNANTVGQIGITTVLVEELRNGAVIGSVTREIQMVTFDCTNNKPSISEFLDKGGRTATVCAGSNLSLQIEGTDKDNNLLSFSLVSGKSGVFNSGSTSTKPIAGFGWFPTSADVGTHIFEVQLTDDGCPTRQSVVERFTITVSESPKVELGNDSILPCVDLKSFDLKPKTLSGGLKPYTYEWKINGKVVSTAETIKIDSLGSVQLKVTDAAGCASTDNVLYYNSISGSISSDPICKDVPGTFVGSGFSASGPIVSYDWIIDGKSYSGKTVQAQLSTSGENNIILQVTDEKGCTSETSKPVTVCVPPVINTITKTDSCSKTSITFNGNVSSLGCPASQFWTVFDSNKNIVSSGPATVNIQDAGDYVVRLVAKTANDQCADTLEMPFTVYPRPTIDILQKSFPFNCTRPDTVFQAFLKEGERGTGELKFEWNTSPDTDTILDVNSIGLYRIKVTDTLGCTHDASRQIFKPFTPNFTYDPVCTPLDTMKFFDLTKLNTLRGLKSFSWDFGDGSPTSSLINPVHYYKTPNDYNVTLTVVDSANCSYESTIKVYNTFYKPFFKLEPNRVKSICVKDVVTGYGILPDEIAGFSHFDEFRWTIAGVPRFYKNGSSFGGPDKGDTITFTFNSNKVEYVSLQVIYNQHPGVHNKECITPVFQDSVDVKPEFRADVRAFRVCLNDTALFSLVDPSTRELKKLISANWKINLANPPFTELYRTDSIKPAYVFRQDKDVTISVSAVDTNGCVLNKTVPASVNKVWQPTMITKSECANVPVTMTVYSADKYQNTDWWQIRDETMGVTMYTEPKFTLINPPDTLVGKPTYTFNREGEARIALYMIHDTKFNGEPTVCRAFYDTVVKLYDLPTVDFLFGEACAQDEAIKFTDKSTVKVGSVKSYEWTFGDGTTSNEQNPSHVYQKGGFYDVTLKVTSAPNDCYQTATKKVYVKYKPIAGFMVDNKEPEAGIPLSFKDTSITFGRSIVFSQYAFENGDISSELDPVYTYPRSEDLKYNVTHTIVTDEGCKDTVVNPIDLNVYLDIPTAFTPNSDGLNNTIGLIYKSIRVLYEFKIFNRWGEVVFDANGDPTKRWDGTYNNKDQEVGVYIVHVKALGAYDTQYNFKKHITLIR